MRCLGAQDVEPGRADGARVRIGSARNSPMPRHHLLAVGQRLPAPVVVEGERDVAELVASRTATPRAWSSRPGPSWHTRTPGRRSVAVGQGQGADHRAAVGLVGDVAGGHHGRNVPRSAATPYWPVRGNPRPCLQVACPVALPRPAAASCSSRPVGADVPPSAPPERPRRIGDRVDTGHRSCHDDDAQLHPAPGPTSGPLQAGAPIALPFSADRVTAAEAPTARSSPRPRTRPIPAPAVAWVIDGNGPAAVAEHVPTGVAALAADGTNFYVATYPMCSRTTASAGTRTASGTCRRSTRPTAPTPTSSPSPPRPATCWFRHAGQHRARLPHQPATAAGPRLARARPRRRRRARRLRLLRDTGPPPGRAATQRRHHHRPGAGPHAERAGRRRPVPRRRWRAAVWVGEPAGQGLDATTRPTTPPPWPGRLLQRLGHDDRGRHVRRPAGAEPLGWRHLPAARRQHAVVVRVPHRPAGRCRGRPGCRPRRAADGACARRHRVGHIEQPVRAIRISGISG